MSDQATRSYRAIAVAIVIAGALISASLFVAFPGATKTATNVMTVTGADPPLSTSTTGNGLDFLLSLNVSQLVTGNVVGINMSLTNVMSTPDNVTADPGAFANLPQVRLGPCGDLNQPFGFLIAQGYYDAGNASSAVPLMLYSPGAYNCPALLDYSYYVFQPYSYLMNACEGSDSCAQFPASYSGAYGVSWTSNGGSQATSAPFKPGVYTVVGVTEWGQIDVLHFTVTSPA
jgi:hypothetical protein